MDHLRSQWTEEQIAQHRLVVDAQKTVFVSPGTLPFGFLYLFLRQQQHTLPALLPARQEILNPGQVFHAQAAADEDGMVMSQVSDKVPNCPITTAALVEPMKKFVGFLLRYVFSFFFFGKPRGP